MKTITLHVQEGTYLAFQNHARKLGRSAAELIREAMEEYLEARIRTRTSLRSWRPVSAGAVLGPLSEEDDVLGEMIEARDGD